MSAAQQKSWKNVNIIIIKSVISIYFISSWLDILDLAISCLCINCIFSHQILQCCFSVLSCLQNRSDRYNEWENYSWMIKTSRDELRHVLSFDINCTLATSTGMSVRTGMLSVFITCTHIQEALTTHLIAVIPWDSYSSLSGYLLSQKWMKAWLHGCSQESRSWFTQSVYLALMLCTFKNTVPAYAEAILDWKSCHHSLYCLLTFLWQLSQAQALQSQWGDQWRSQRAPWGWTVPKTPQGEAICSSTRDSQGLTKACCSILTQIHTGKTGLAAFLHWCKIRGLASHAASVDRKWRVPSMFLFIASNSRRQGLH